MARKLKRVVKEDFGSFVERFDLLPPPQPAPPKAPHTLAGLTFAVADEYEFIINYENWITSIKPTITPCVSDNLSAPAENGILIDCCQTTRSEVQLAIHSLLKDKSGRNLASNRPCVI